MPEVSNNDEIIIQPGRYQIVFNSAATGTGKIQISKDNGVTFQDMTGISYSASADTDIWLGGAIYKFVLTGDGKMWYDKIGN